MLKLWRVSNGKLLDSFGEHSHGVHSLAFSPDGTLLAAGLWDGKIWMWRISDGVLLYKLAEHTEDVRSLAFSPDGRLLASGGKDMVVNLWFVANGVHLHKLEGHTDSVEGIVFAEDGETLASGARDGTVRLWHYGKGILINTLVHPFPVVDIAFGSHNSVLATGVGVERQEGWLWWATNGKITNRLTGHNNYIEDVVFSSGGTVLASTDGYQIKLWSSNQ